MIIAKILCLIAISIVCLMVIGAFASSLFESLKDFKCSWGGDWYTSAFLTVMTLLAISGSIVLILFIKGAMGL